MNGAPTNRITVFFEADDFLALLTGDSCDDWTIGGAEVQQSYLARSFAVDERFHVVLAANRPRPAALDDGFTYVQIPAHLKRGLPIAGRIVNLLRSRATFDTVKPPAVFLQTQYERFDLTYAAQRAGIKIVRWINGDSLVDGSNLIDETARRRLNYRLKMADALVAQSPHQQQLIAQNLHRESTVIGSIVPAMGGVGAEADTHTDTHTRFGARTALWVGRCHPVKNPEAFLDLAETLPEVYFTLVAAPCDATQEYQDAITTRANSLSNVTLHAGLSLDATQRLYGQVSLCVNTSHSEGMPNTLIEAFAAGIPTAALTVNPEGLLVEENGCFCAEGDPKDLARWIQRMLDDVVLYAAQCDKVQLGAKKQWSNEKVVDDYYRLFVDVTR
ncbi:MAG: glycosyltransferase family 4 protein [Coriobacteriia bacterium]|nr:glycosyltransferase family 4 protein [Coriobacteriia bacterium]